MSWDWAHKHASMDLHTTFDAWHYKPESGELAACRNTAMECSASALRSIVTAINFLAGSYDPRDQVRSIHACHRIPKGSLPGAFEIAHQYVLLLVEHTPPPAALLLFELQSASVEQGTFVECV